MFVGNYMPKFKLFDQTLKVDEKNFLFQIAHLKMHVIAFGR